MLLAFYIELQQPIFSTDLSQSYKIHCLTINESANVTVRLENNTAHLITMKKHCGFATYDYEKEVIWNADKVEMTTTEFSNQGLNRYNGDHDWTCSASYSNGYDDLQTYVRGMH